MTHEERVTNEARARILKALAHPSRIFIVDKLQNGPKSVNELARLVGSDVSTVSRHLSVLKSVGVLIDRRDGVMTYYSLACPCVRSFFEGVEMVLRHNLSMHQSALNTPENVTS